MDKKVYILSETIDRDITPPVAYFEFNSALCEMYSRMAQALGYSEAKILQMLEDMKLNDRACITVDNDTGIAVAYGNTPTNKACDWYINPVEIPG